jgi:hypothetical protein
VDALTCLEDGTSQSDDAILLQRASGSAVCCTVRTPICSASPRSGKNAGGIFLFYGHQLQLTIGQAVHDLYLAVQVLELDDMRNRVEYSPL